MNWFRRIVLAVVTIFVAVTLPSPTAALAHVYDAPAVASADVHELGAVRATQPQLLDQRKGSVSPLPSAQGTSTTPVGSFIATEAAGVLDEAASGQGTVLGRFRGGTEEYLGKPGFNVFDLPSKGTGRWYWSRNEAFIDYAIAAGDEIRLVTNPYEPIYSGGNTFQREIRYLKDLGYTFQESGDHWVAVPGR